MKLTKKENTDRENVVIFVGVNDNELQLHIYESMRDSENVYERPKKGNDKHIFILIYIQLRVLFYERIILLYFRSLPFCFLGV
jgi:hypothetical protein